MNKFFVALLALIAMLVSIVLFAPQLVPAEKFKGPIETAATNALGREVFIGDDLSFKILPQIAFHVTDLTIANAEGFDGPPLAHIKQADIGVKLKPLLSRNVEISRFVLNEPTLSLVRAKNGAVNWDLATSSEAQTKTETTANSEPEVRELKLGEVFLNSGKATYQDHTSNTTYVLEKMNLKTTLDSLSTPMKVEGDLLFQGAPANINLVVTTLADLIAQKPANVKFDGTLSDTTAGADLDLTMSDESFSYSGPVNFKAPNLPQLAKIFGVELQDAPGFDRFNVSGNAQGDPSSVRLKVTSMQFDEINADGNLRLDWTGTRPKATGSLTTALLDLRPYMPEPTETTDGFPAWSNAPIDFSSLRNIDADLNVSTSAMKMNALSFGKSEMKIRISNGRLVADLTKLKMYDGDGSGQLIVNARQATPSFSGDFVLGAVNSEPLAKDLFRSDRLLGLGAFNIKFSASGSSQAAIMNTIDGEGGFDFEDGALKGVNIGKIVSAASSLTQGFDPAVLQQAVATARSPYEQTDFSQFLSRFTIKDGLMTSPTINLNAPFLKMTGSGTVNLPSQTLDLRLLPRAVKSLEDNAGGVTIPMRVTGSFSDPKIAVDVEAIARTKLKGGLQNIIGDALNKNGAKDGAGADAPKSDKEKAGELLLDIIGGKKKDGASLSGPDGESSASSDPASTEELLANEAINLIFGNTKASQAGETSAAEGTSNNSDQN